MANNFNRGMRGPDLKLVGKKHDPKHVPNKPTPEQLARGKVRRAIEDIEDQRRLRNADLW